MRLDSYLAQYWPEYSRSQWQRYLKDGRVTVNGDVVMVSKFELGEDDEVQVSLPEAPNFNQQSLPVLYEDENVAVINKPAGVLTHAKGALSEEFTVAEFMRDKQAEASEGNRPGIVHRLDRDTSGVMIATKNEVARSHIQREFTNKNVKKEYLAVVSGTLKTPEAILRLPIERNPKEPSRFRVASGGKPAETSYKVLAEADGRSLVLLRPLTGRTHQLRVHMNYIGHPIIGDRFYAPKVKSGERMALHAYRLELTLPGGKRSVFYAEPDSNFTDIFPNYQPEMIA